MDQVSYYAMSAVSGVRRGWFVFTNAYLSILLLQTVGSLFDGARETSLRKEQASQKADIA